MDIARKTRSKPAAKMISAHFQAKGDYQAVLEFNVLAGQIEEAFSVAAVSKSSIIGIAKRIFGAIGPLN
jgi:hypothetical protein